MSSARDARVSLHFKLPYWTQWGQNLVVLLSQGSDGTKRHALNCTHQSEELVWEGETQVSASARGLEYSYAIIDEADEIEAEEVSRRALALPDGLADGSVIELRDSWQVGDCGRCSFLDTTVYRFEARWKGQVYCAGHIPPKLSDVEWRLQREHPGASRGQPKPCCR